MRVAVDDGIDPSAEKADRIEAAKLTLQADRRRLPRGPATQYAAAVLRSRRSATCEVHWAPLHKLPIASISRATIAGRLREIVKDSGPVAADRARSSLSALFGWAIGEGYCREQSRHRHQQGQRGYTARSHALGR